MKTSTQALIEKGILTPSGETNKKKIDLVVGATTRLAEMVWATKNGDMDTINRLTDILVTMKTTADNGELFKISKEK